MGREAIAAIVAVCVVATPAMQAAAQPADDKTPTLGELPAIALGPRRPPDAAQIARIR